MNICEKLKKARENKKISLSELSAITGIAKSTLQRYETGSTKKIPLDAISKIERALNLQAGYLMGWIDAAPEENNNKKNELTEDIVIYQRNGETMRKKLTKEQMDMLTAMLEAIPEVDNPDL